MLATILILLFTIVFSEECQPYGVRLFLGHYFSYLRNSQDIIRVVFNTKDNCENTFLLDLNYEYGVKTTVTYYESELLNMTKIYEGSTTPYTYETWVHTFKVGLNHIDLKQSTEYNYTIKTKQDQVAGPFKFDIPLARNEQKMLVFGDMDSNWVQNYSNYTFNWLENQVKENQLYDTILFTGDMAYDLESQNCQQGDNWLRNISIFANRYPFMAAPGNHDWGNNTKFEFFRVNFGNLYLKEFNTEHYLNDLTSFDVGLVHFIHFNPIKIVYNNDPYNITPIIVDLMKNDLIIANQNRNKVPWIIVYSHYPIYCSSDADQCLNNYKYLADFENLFVKYKVDLYLCGHQHNYQRNKPYYQNKLAQYNVKNGNVIYNYNYPVSIIEGVGGTDYGEQNQTFDEKPFMEFQNPDHGVGILTVKNSTHLYFEHITVQDNKVIDKVWIEKDDVTQVTTKRDGFEVTMWVLFATLLVITGVSIYYKVNQNKKVNKLMEDVTMVVS